MEKHMERMLIMRDALPHLIVPNSTFIQVLLQGMLPKHSKAVIHARRQLDKYREEHNDETYSLQQCFALMFEAERYHRDVAA